MNPPELSYWEREHLWNPPDLVIIGAGIVGLSAALFLKLKSPGKKIWVLERGLLPSGASSRNAGFACYGSITELMDDTAKYGESTMLQLVEWRWKGLQRLLGLYGTSTLEYQPWGGYELFAAPDHDAWLKANDQIPRFNQLVAPITGLAQTYKVADHQLEHFSFGKVEHLIFNSGEGVLNPGKLMKHLAAKCRHLGIELHYGTEVKQIEDGADKASITLSSGYSFSVSQVLVTTNGFARQLMPVLDVKPARNQVWITAPIADLNWAGAFHYQEGYYYFRRVEDRILLGGGRHLDLEGETTAEFGATTSIQAGLQQLLEEIIWPGQPVSIDLKWSGIMGLGGNKKPIVKSLSPHVLVAVRMGGMGVAIGTLVGEEAANLLATGNTLYGFETLGS